MFGRETTRTQFIQQYADHLQVPPSFLKEMDLVAIWREHGCSEIPDPHWEMMTGFELATLSHFGMEAPPLDQPPPQDPA